MAVPARFTQLLTALLWGDGQDHVGPGTLISLRGFVAVSSGVGGHHILCHLKETIYRTPEVRGSCHQSQEESSWIWHAQTWVGRPTGWWGFQLQQGAPAPKLMFVYFNVL